MLIITSVLVGFFLAACQAATDPTRRPTSGSATPVGTAGAERSKATASPTVRKPALATPSPTALPESLLGVTASDLKGTQVEYWHVWEGQAGRLMAEMVDEFNQTNPWGVRVEAAYVGNFDALNEQVLTAMQEGETPDLAVAFDYQASNWDAQEEITVGLGEYIHDPLWGWDEAEQADYLPMFWGHEDDEDKIIGFPIHRSGELLYYNTSWAEELGFRTSPATVAQFRTQACAAARANQQDDDPQNDNTGGWIISTDPSTVTGWLYASGSPITRPDGNGYRLNTPEVEQTLRFLRELYEQGCAWLPEDRHPEEAFTRREGLFSAGSVLGIPFQQTAMSSSGSSDEWTVIPFPASGGEPAISIYGPSLVVLKSTPEKQLASWLLIQWLSSPDNQARWAQTTAAYPLRASALEQLQENTGLAPQWYTATELLEYAHPEPNLRSWETVRWALSDAATQLFRWYFTLEQLPDTIKLLDQTAAELNNRSK